MVLNFSFFNRSNFMFENPYFTIIGWFGREIKFKFDFKKIDWKEEEVEF